MVIAMVVIMVVIMIILPKVVFPLSHALAS